MIPIQDLLNRIRWDQDFARGEFIVGYYDRLEGRILRVPFGSIHFSHGDHFAFQVIDEEGQLHSIPFHRVREVFRDGELIWERPARH